jgi:hypothetical protein
MPCRKFLVKGGNSLIPSGSSHCVLPYTDLGRPPRDGAHISKLHANVGPAVLREPVGGKAQYAETGAREEGRREIIGCTGYLQRLEAARSEEQPYRLGRKKLWMLKRERRPTAAEQARKP